MKISKIIAAFSVSAIAASTVTAFDSNAISIVMNSDSPYYQQYIDKFVELDDHGFFRYSLGNRTNDYKVYCSAAYADKMEKVCRVITIHEFLPYHMSIEIPSDADAEEVRAIIEKYDPSLQVTFGTTEIRGENGIFVGSLVDVYDYDRKPETVVAARNIFRELSEITDVFSCDYYSGMISEMNLSYYDSLTTYSGFGTGESYEEIAEKLTYYFAENDLDFSVREYEYMDSICCEAYPNYPLTAQEHLDIAVDIYEKLGYSGHYVSPNSASFSKDCKIDLCNSVAGDANNDGEVDIADATLILQHIGNADKYALSLQGAYNADIDGNGDVTALDSLAIQKIDAKTF